MSATPTPHAKTSGSDSAAPGKATLYLITGRYAQLRRPVESLSCLGVIVTSYAAGLREVAAMLEGWSVPESDALEMLDDLATTKTDGSWTWKEFEVNGGDAITLEQKPIAIDTTASDGCCTRFTF